MPEGNDLAAIDDGLNTKLGGVFLSVRVDDDAAIGPERTGLANDAGAITRGVERNKRLGHGDEFRGRG